MKRILTALSSLALVLPAIAASSKVPYVFSRLRD
jgi:hypothetical protein